MPPVNTSEPLIIIAGDTVSWQKTIPDYPASQGWTLHYRLINAAGKIDITGSASGDDHVINIPAATSAPYVAGKYDWQSYVTNVAGDRYTIALGNMEVKANWALQAGGLDVRSNARQILDYLETAWIAAAAKRAYVFEYKVAGRQMRFATRGEWIAEMDYWRREVAREMRAEKIAAGLDSGRKVYVRF